MRVFRVIPFFAAFATLSNAAAIPRTSTQDACAREKSVITHVHDLVEQIHAELALMHSQLAAQTPSANVENRDIRPVNNMMDSASGISRNLITILIGHSRIRRELADTADGIANDVGGTVSRVAEEHGREGNGRIAEGVFADAIVGSGDQPGLVKKAIALRVADEACANEKGVLVHVHELAGALHEKLLLLQAQYGSGVDPGHLQEVLGLVRQVLSLVGGVLNGVVGSVVGNVVGGVVGGTVLGTAVGTDRSIAGGVLGTVVGTVGGVLGNIVGIVPAGAGGVVNGAHANAVPGGVVGLAQAIV